MDQVTVKRMWRIVERYCDENRVPMQLLLSETRQREVVRHRWNCFALLRAQGCSLPQIGGLFGMHHTTVLHGLRRVTDDAA